MKQARKRAPGGGRKPRGPIAGKTAAFTTRITAETRAALEAEAADAGLSVSQVAERFLRAGIEARRERDRDDPLRALCFVIAETAAQVGGVWGPDGKPAADWRNDPFLYEAFRLAVGQLLEALRPPGEIRAVVPMPDANPGDRWSNNINRSFSSPEARAQDVAMMVWNALQNPKPLLSREAMEIWGAHGTEDQRRRYGMFDARNALGLDKAGGKS